jgi:RNA polymerase sigma-70 factor (ECF subfamily)
VNAEKARSIEDGIGLSAEDRSEWFAEFISENERAIRQSLTGALGVDPGREATAEALAYGWEHRDRLEGMDNPAGYLYRVGLNWGRKSLSRRTVVFPADTAQESEWVEPRLPEALAALSERQRVVVYLVHGHDWSLSEVAELLEISKGTAQKHMERGMTRLRRELKVDS